MIGIGKPLVLAAAVLALAGCDRLGVQVEDHPGPRASYFDGDFEYAAHKGAVLTHVVGNPFDVPDSVFADAVIARMQGHARANTTGRFVAAPSDQTIAPFNVVVAFNMPQPVDGGGLCRGPAALPPGRKGSGIVTMDIAFCFGDGIKTDARGVVYQVAGLEDPKFTRLIHRVTEAMIPSRDGMSTFEDSNPR